MIVTVHIKKWEEFKRIGRSLSGYTAFRGQANADWDLTTLLERGLKEFPAKELDPFQREQVLLREFQRRAHHYLENTPEITKKLEWLALIQHYGGPTRLLDFSYSPYIAAFFALESACGDATVWAIDLSSIKPPFHNKKFEKIFLGSDVPLDQKNVMVAEKLLSEKKATDRYVIPVEPERLNERMSIQQGLFIMPSDLNCTFMDNLSACVREPSEVEELAPNRELSLDDKLKIAALDVFSVTKFVLPRNLHKLALFDLDSMNINSASLFPGLEGFSRSLKKHLRVVDDANDLSELTMFDLRC